MSVIKRLRVRCVGPVGEYQISGKDLDLILRYLECCEELIVRRTELDKAEAFVEEMRDRHPEMSEIEFDESDYFKSFDEVYKQWSDTALKEIDLFEELTK